MQGADGASVQGAPASRTLLAGAPVLLDVSRAGSVSRLPFALVGAIAPRCSAPAL